MVFGHWRYFETAVLGKKSLDCGPANFGEIVFLSFPFGSSSLNIVDTSEAKTN